MQSLVWITLFIVINRTVQFNIEMLFVDFIHGNPHRPRSNALSMMVTDTPIFALFNIIACFLVLTVPQFFQAAIVCAFEPAYGDGSRFLALAALPVTAVITWYCYDYLTPSNICFAGSCTEPYEHGLSPSRYVMALAVLTPITLFSFLYLSACLRDRSKMSLLLVALAIAILLGAIGGYVRAREQYQFL
jgi:hypothetical protein